MAYQTLSENTRTIISQIKTIIQEEKATIGQHQPGTGWQYSGPEISNATNKLVDELNNDDFQVVKCHVLHLVNNGLIHNKTGHLLIFPLQGTAKFGPDEPLLQCHHIEETKTIYGQNVDLIIVALQEKQ